MSRFLICGADGMLANAILTNEYFNDNTAYGRQVFNLCDTEQMREVIRRDKPEYVINCAAFTDVTKAESDYQAAYSINALGTKNLCELSKEFGFVLIHFSTDFVFKGDLEQDKREDDRIDPVNAYGKSKAEGEQFIIDELDEYLIMRVSWLYGPKGRNFVSIISSLMREKPVLNIVSDQYGRTTYTIDIAEALGKLIDRRYRGVVHFANEGVCSRYEFTREIYRILNEEAKIDCEIKPIKASEYNDPTPRPSYSVLNTERYEELCSVKIRNWKEALAEFIRENR